MSSNENSLKPSPFLLAGFHVDFAGFDSMLLV